MIRTIQIITAAIQISAPNLSDSTAQSYAKTLQVEAKARHFDPFTVVAMVHHESHWDARVVNSIGCVGLGQICLSNYPYCRGNKTGEKCQAKRAQLQNGSYNLRTVAELITRNRAFCRRKTSRPALFRYWLASYQGLNSRKREHWCGQHLTRGRWRDLSTRRITRRVISYRLNLMRKTAKAKK